MRIHEVISFFHKKIAESIAAMKNKIIDKMDQLMSLVSGCDAKIEAYNASMEERIKTKISGLVRNNNMEKVVGRDGEIWVDRSPILQTPNSKNSGSEDGTNGREKMMRPNFLHPPKIEIPSFSGEDPRSWMKKCNKFFTMHQVNDYVKMDIIEMYLEGKVDTWYQGFKKMNDKVSWVIFSDVIMKRFGKTGGMDVQEEFNKLPQVGSVMEYVERFEELKSLVLCRNAKLKEGY